MSRKRRLSNRCSAGFARRISFSRCDERQQRPVERALLQPRTSPSRGTPRCPRAPARSRSARSRVDAVRRRERRGEHEPGLERGRAAALQVLVQDVRRVREEVRPVERAPSRRSMLDELDAARALRVLPGEVRVRLAEADLGERLHHRRPRERLGEEDHVRDRRPRTSAISHSQNGTGFVCGLSTRKTRTPRRHQSRTTSRSAVPEPLPVLASRS